VTAARNVTVAVQTGGPPIPGLAGDPTAALSA
jgi:hypothetical protein